MTINGHACQRFQQIPDSDKQHFSCFIMLTESSNNFYAVTLTISFSFTGGRSNVLVVFNLPHKRYCNCNGSCHNPNRAIVSLVGVNCNPQECWTYAGFAGALNSLYFSCQNLFTITAIKIHIPQHRKKNIISYSQRVIKSYFSVSCMYSPLLSQLFLCLQNCSNKIFLWYGNRMQGAK